jgi:hypothetical protein
MSFINLLSYSAIFIKGSSDKFYDAGVGYNKARDCLELYFHWGPNGKSGVRKVQDSLSGVSSLLGSDVQSIKRWARIAFDKAEEQIANKLAKGYSLAGQKGSSNTASLLSSLYEILGIDVPVDPQNESAGNYKDFLAMIIGYVDGAWQAKEECDNDRFGPWFVVENPRNRRLSIMDTVTVRQTPSGAFVL